MEDNNKVFNSSITRAELKKKNNLYDLLHIAPAKPIRSKCSENETSYFRPLADKYYVPKNTSRLKVRTVREIRNLFEQDNYNFIMEDMEKQKDMLFTKIKSGSAKDANTKNLAKKILEADQPISRTAWQMIKNINPENHSNPTQFVLWNGKHLKVMGTKGDRNRFICNYDFGKKSANGKKAFLGNEFKKHRGLLRNSLNIKFKPGPLRRKQNLDDSHHKYHMGPIELVIVPKPALDIQPAYGIALEPIMTSFLYNLRAEDGVITKTWAEFAVSVLGKFNNKNLVHIDKNISVSFDLRYKCDQNRILMRKDIRSSHTEDENATSVSFSTEQKSDNTFEIKDIMDKVLSSVEISLSQDCMYSIENDEFMRTQETKSPDTKLHNLKEKVKKRYGELDRLDVTVIQLPGTPIQDYVKSCGKPYCNLGCICDSLQYKHKFKQHCGLLDCMFACKCELTKYKELDFLQNGCDELIPGLINLDSEINSNLAKEEQKFHQTVVVSGEKSIVLKSTKRNLKTSRKYAEFYSNLRRKSEKGQKKILTVMERKLNCYNIEPWCMVHNLYKCFCKGRFTESTRVNNTVHSITTIDELNNEHVNIKQTDIRNILRPRARLRMINAEKTASNSILKRKFSNRLRCNCARINGYCGRKHEDGFYKITHVKIEEMEKYDAILYEKMMRLKNNAELSPEPDNSEGSATGYHGDKMINEEVRLKTCFDNNVQKMMRLKNNAELSPEPDNSEGSATGYHGDKMINEEVRLKTCFNNNVQKMSDNKETIIIKSPGETATTESSKDCSTVEKMLHKDGVPFEISSGIYKPVYGSIMKQEFLVRWMALGYKHFKQRLLQRKVSLEIPKKGKIILHSWEFVLRRYRERKNLFMVSKNKPFRIFMARDANNYFLENCINIDTIRFADLHKYPFCVKNLLTNATSEEHFCILGGWEFCWEIVGSVKQCGDHLQGTSLSSTENSVNEKKNKVSDNINTKTTTRSQDVKLSEKIDSSGSEMLSSERSKWFLMMLEHDFVEIRCHSKGFYVKRDKIIHIIELARITRKTIVINKQTETEFPNIPFGIYAIPNTTDYCVFVGPYETDESLGLEVVKTNSKLNDTRGVWITTNKVDNMKVLDDPLSFIKQKTNRDDHSQMVSIETRNNATTTNNQPITSQRLKKVQNNDPVLNGKIVKPIKIRRINGLYHLSPKKNTMQTFSPNHYVKPKGDVITNPNLINLPYSTMVDNSDQNVHLDESHVDTISSNEPAADGLSHLKIISIHSENSKGTEKINNEKKKPSMFILKPEEINKRLSNYKLIDHTIGNDNDIHEMSTDIEHFLRSPSEAASATQNDVLIISDDEQDDPDVEDTITNTTVIINKIHKKEKLLNLLEKNKINMVSENIIPEPITSKSPKTPKLTMVADSGQFEHPKPPNVSNKACDMIEGLEETSRLLEDESVMLWNETEKRQTEIIKTLQVPEGLKYELTETLQDLKSLNDHVMDD